jgi:hypothetical protein
MKINLKQLALERQMLIHAQKLLANTDFGKGISRKLTKTIRFIENIELDLEMCGESIVELDRPRLDAIEEKTKMLNFMENGDDF